MSSGDKPVFAATCRGLRALSAAVADGPIGDLAKHEAMVLASALTHTESVNSISAFCDGGRRVVVKIERAEPQPTFAVCVFRGAHHV